VVQLFGAAGTAAALGPQSRAIRHAARTSQARPIEISTWPMPTARNRAAQCGFGDVATVTA
jgi:hypothetical protein